VLQVDERRGAFAEGDRLHRPRREEMAEAPETFSDWRERVARHAGEWGQIILDSEVDGDVLRAAERAAGEETRLVESRVATEASKSKNVRLGGHGGVV
jgi:hypothetical protein